MCLRPGKECSRYRASLLNGRGGGARRRTRVSGLQNFEEILDVVLQVHNGDLSLPLQFPVDVRILLARPRSPGHDLDLPTKLQGPVDVRAEAVASDRGGTIPCGDDHRPRTVLAEEE